MNNCIVLKKEENSNISLFSINQAVKNSRNSLHSVWTIKQALSRGETCLKGIIDPKKRVPCSRSRKIIPRSVWWDARHFEKEIESRYKFFNYGIHVSGLCTRIRHVYIIGGRTSWTKWSIIVCCWSIVARPLLGPNYNSFIGRSHTYAPSRYIIFHVVAHKTKFRGRAKIYARSARERERERTSRNMFPSSFLPSLAEFASSSKKSFLRAVVGWTAFLWDHRLFFVGSRRARDCWSLFDADDSDCNFLFLLKQFESTRKN